MPDIRVLLVDDQELFRAGIARILDAQEGITVVGEAQVVILALVLGVDDPLACELAPGRPPFPIADDGIVGDAAEVLLGEVIILAGLGDLAGTFLDPR